MRALLLLLTVAVAFAAKRFDGEQVLRIHPQHDGHLKELRSLEMAEARLDFWKGPTALSRPVDVRVPREMLKEVKTLLEKTGMEYTVMVEDLQQNINSERSRVRSTGFNFDDYNTIDDIDAQLQTFAATYPSLTSVFTIGTSHHGRAINAIKVGAAGTNKPAIFLEGQIHAREWVVSATLLLNIKYLLEGYGSNSQITEFMNTLDFYFIPVTNVDGYIYTWTHDRMWRKTRSGPHSQSIWGSCYGVDPNRNWDDHFAGPGTSSDPCSDLYHGPSPFSEVETEAVSNWVLANSNNIKSYLSVHAYSQMWMTPYGWTYAHPPDYEDQYNLAGRIAGAIQGVHRKRFAFGTIADVIYEAAGSSCDWAYSKVGVKYSFAIELRDEGRYGFVLPADQIRPSAEEFFAGLMVLASQVQLECRIVIMNVLLFFFTVTVASAITRFDGEQVLRVIPQDERQLQDLVRLEREDIRLDFWKSPGGVFRPVDVRVPRNLLTHVRKLLGNTGIQYTVMIDDLQQLINNQTSPSSANEFDFDNYNSYEEINTQLQDFVDKHQSLTSLIKIGVSHESRDIYAIRVGSSGTIKPAIFLEGQIHAREWIVSATLLYNIKFLLDGYGTEDRITKLMDEVDFYFLPVTNVDGYVYTWTNNRLWRKTRSGPIDGCYGVDPNRNWDDHFGEPGASDNPCSDTYHGPTAFSEVETKSLSNWVLENGKDIKAYLAVHSYSEMWMSPYGWTHDLPRDYEEQNDLGAKTVNAIREVNGLNFKHGSIANVIYMTSGNSADWAYDVAGIKYSYAIELRDNGRYGFVLPPEQIKPSAEEFFAALLVVAEQIANE
ncbi:uncharacterized protein LOC144914754 [Branchiostoma floridae x Branchiostoma belcheri]